MTTPHAHSRAHRLWTILMWTCLAGFLICFLISLPALNEAMKPGDLEGIGVPEKPMGLSGYAAYPAIAFLVGTVVSTVMVLVSGQRRAVSARS